MLERCDAVAVGDRPVGARGQDRLQLGAVVEIREPTPEALLGATTAEWLQRFATADVLCSRVNGIAEWLAEPQVQAMGAADAKFDFVSGNRNTAFTFDVALDPGDTVVAAGLRILPKAESEAEARRLARFEPHGHSPGMYELGVESPHPEFPFTLDLRRAAGI